MGIINTFKSLLRKLDFIEANNLFTKHFETQDCDVKVDFNKEEIIYPENKGFKVNERQILSKYLYEYFISTWEIHFNNKGQFKWLSSSAVKSIQIPVPPLSEQQKIVAEVEKYEVEIAKAKAVMDGCAERKKAILDKYLS